MTTFAPSAIGYFGKLPARGDFVGAGVAEAFLAPWDGWCRGFLAASRDGLGAGWEPAWMEAPIWHFLLPAGACGPLAVLGVWLASMDRVGRHFPFAACAFAESSVDLEAGGEWLARAEAVALSGVVEDASHEDFLARLSAPVPLSLLSGPGWWTEGSPLVQPRRLDLYGLPPLEMAAGMLRDGAPAGAEI
jgi:type VI secretion system protein ImpM